MVMQSDAPRQTTQPDGVSEHAPLINGPLPGPLAEEIVARDIEVISPSYTRSYPFAMDHGLGSMVWDVDGNRFIDFTAGVAVLNAGHCHPEVVQAVKDQAEKFLHMAGTDFTTPMRSNWPRNLAASPPATSTSRCSSPIQGPRLSRLL